MSILRRNRKDEHRALRAQLESKSAELESKSAELETRNAELESRNAELEQARAEVARLQSECEQASRELAAAREAQREAEALRREIERLRAPSGQTPPPGIAVADLPPTMQQLFPGMTLVADPKGILVELWDRLMEQEGRLNAVREELNRRNAEMEWLRTQLAGVYRDLVDPVTAVSAGLDLLTMRKDLPTEAGASIEEIRQMIANLRQATLGLRRLTEADGTRK